MTTIDPSPLRRYATRLSLAAAIAFSPFLGCGGSTQATPKPLPPKRLPPRPTAKLKPGSAQVLPSHPVALPLTPSAARTS